MTRFEERWADNVLRAFIEPTSSGLITRDNEVDYLACMRQMRAASTRLAAFGLRIATWIVALAPLWLWGTFATVSGIPSERRTRLLNELLTHRSMIVRELTLLLKLTASMALLGTASVRARSGYDSVTQPKLKKRLPLAS